MGQSLRRNSRQKASRLMRVLAPVVVSLLLVLQPAMAGAAPEILPAGQDTAGAPASSTEAIFSDCDVVEEPELRAELNQISQEIFTPAGGSFDLAALVAQEWAALEMDAMIDAEVARAVAEVQADEDLWSQFWSGWSPAKAEELTRKVATIAFGSVTFAAGVEALSTQVAEALGREISMLSAESASQAMICLQQYIGQNYSDALVTAFGQEIQTGADAVDVALEEHLDASILTVAGQHKSALGGIGVIVASQIAKRVVQQIGKSVSKRVAGRLVGRVVGKAGSTVIPAVGWAVGAALIVYDVVESREGALPQIQTSLQAPEVKEAIQAEIVAGIEPELQLELPQIARAVANDLYADWLDFQRKYRQILSLADGNAQFQDLLATTGDLGYLASLVDMILQDGGPDALNTVIEDGTLAQVAALPAGILAMVQAGLALEDVILWSEVAGSRLDDMVAYEIYKHKAPTDLTRDQLLALLAVDHAATIGKLTLLDTATIEQLLSLAGAHLTQVAGSLSADDLQWLAAYLAELDQEQRNQLVVTLMENPQRMALLKDEGVRTQVVASRNLAQTLAFMAAPVDLMAFVDHLLLLGSGQIGLRLFAYKYGVLVTATAVALPLLLLLALLSTLLSWILAPINGLLRLLRPQRRARAPEHVQPE